jgi:hypothetical protein
MPATLAIDFGARYVGVALVEHPAPHRNRVLYAATVVIEPKPLNTLSEARAQARRLRRTRKTHRRRLRRLAQALAGLPGAADLLRFCRRRGYSHEEQEDAEPGTESFHYHRSDFFAALRSEINRLVPPEHQERALAVCSRHLNEDCRPGAEPRPARFDNRGPTHCAWEGCGRNVPKAANDVEGRLRQALFAWLLPVFAQSKDLPRLRRSVEHWVAELDGLARARHRADDQARKAIDRRANRVCKALLARIRTEAEHDVAELFAENWKRHYRKAVTAALRGAQGGRSRYCRAHSRAFVDHLLAGKQVPNRADLSEADLVSRKQQIVFRRLWRLVEARLLPLAGGRIDRVVVERVAFDVLAGPFKARQALSPERAAELYWSGPGLGFASPLAMLKTEFGGRCAYCGQSGATDQVEHLLPRSAFPFDSYFNLLPACSACNVRKGARTALEAGLTVHDDAYNAYCDYVRKRKNPPPHLYHAVKKGLLNLLRRPATSQEAERRLAMLANDLVTVTASQRSPRPLARYLAGRLARQTGHRPEVAYRAGRHTALYRSVLLPDYGKEAAKEGRDLRNHAVDAIVLGCDLPSATALENKNWKLGASAIQTWFANVKDAAPDTLLGLPRVEPAPWVPFFEQDLGGGYCRIDLSAFNWNHGRKATHALDPFGQTTDGRPLKRVPAAEVLAELKDPARQAAQIALVAHPALRKTLEDGPKEEVAVRFVRWLQGTVQAGLGQTRSTHPADRARRQLHEAFVGAKPEKVVSGEESIPPTVGVRCLNLGSQGKTDVQRVGRDGCIFQRYQAQPVWRALYVGYRLRDGQPDRKKPVLFLVNQAHALRRQAGGKRWPVDAPADSPLHGRPHGAQEPRRAFLTRWRSEFEALCQREGLAEVFQLVQGCVVEKEDGTRFQFRNFERGGAWMRAASFQGIRRVYRSPLQQP